MKAYRPTTPGRRGMTDRDTSPVAKKRPEKTLVSPKKSITGRNSDGKITIRHRGGGAKRLYRLVDFKQLGVSSLKVLAIEYDPNRSANIALAEDEGGVKYYVLAGSKMKAGQTIKVGEDAAIKPGHRLTLKQIPAGTTIYNIELQPGKGGQLVRSAGASAQLTAKDKEYAQVKLPSGEIRLIHLNCYATIGSVGNEAHQNIKLGSAGRVRRMGRRPHVRGKAMNPSDHPMGGGEGQTGPGRLPRTPWGKIAIGAKTRRRKSTTKYIVRSRHLGKRK